MMMRQFLRVKQIADHTFQRSEKGEILTEELSAAEKRVDLIQQSCAASGKKLSACTQRIAPDTADKKTTKRVPEALLAQCMEEWGLHLGESSILGMTLVDCARIQESLACDLLIYKAQVEDKVVEPLQNILKIDVASILKYRKQLVKLMSDMNSAKMRYQSALKNCQQAAGGSPASVAKADLLREEAEDSVARVDQCRDSLAAEMFNLISREPEMSQLFVRLCHLELEYHRKALATLEASLPELETQIRSCPYHPVFGFPLEDHLEVTKREIAVVIETCICWLLESAMDEEGLFRIGGSLTKIKKIKSAFDAGLWHLMEDDRDPHNIAGVLKLYLRSLPEPLLTYALYDDWLNAATIQDHDTKLQSLWTVVNSLPEANLKNLRYLIKFLSRLSQNSDVNKMSSQNIAIVIGPNLLWPQVEESVLGMNMTATNLHSSIVDTLLTYSDWFFPGECDFQVSTPTSPRHMDGFPPSFLSGSQLSLATAKLSNGDSALDSLSSSPTNSSPKSPSPRAPLRPRKKAAPAAPDPNFRSQITRSLSCGVFQPNSGPGPPANGRRLAQHSVSHEDISAGFEEKGSRRSESLGEGRGYETTPRSPMNGNVRLRCASQTKPARRRRGLPPVAERSLKPIERPSVPPPERPDSLIVASQAAPLSATPETSRTVDLDDVSISLDSSGSETYNDCQMNFMDDCENFEETPLQEADSVQIATADVTATTTNSPHFFGGTPTWFDHYGGDKRQSDTVWFNSQETDELSTCFESSDVFLEETTETSEAKDCGDEADSKEIEDNFRTIIEVQSVNGEFSQSNTKVSGTAIKLRVNSQSQNTRL